MKNSSVLVLYYTRDNRYSFNVLLGALEGIDLEGLDVCIIEDDSKLLLSLEEFIDSYKKS